jgi:hypothetical protein
MDAGLRMVFLVDSLAQLALIEAWYLRALHLGCLKCCWRWV